MPFRLTLMRLAVMVTAVTVLLGANGVGAAADGGPRVRIETTLGAITLTLDDRRAPRTVTNFLNYARSGFYDGTVFHRVIPGFMIQGGGLDAALQRKATGAPVVNEAHNGLANRRGTVAMARTNQPHSATSQFFINLVDNAFLDHRAKTAQGWGYCVFGRVVEGLEVVDRIAGVATGVKGGRRDVPLTPVVIETVRVVD